MYLTPQPIERGGASICVALLSAYPTLQGHPAESNMLHPYRDHKSGTLECDTFSPLVC